MPGHLQAICLPKDVIEPILLLPNQHVTELLIREAHVRCGHQGVNGTLASVRRQIVRKCLKHCLTCKKWNGKPYFYPTSPPLPTARTQPTKPFSHIGIDLAGPFTIIDSDHNKIKKWIFLSTGMTTRAIHLEVTKDLSALQIINVLRRIISRRGKPQLITSDNATNFKQRGEPAEGKLNETSGCLNRRFPSRGVIDYQWGLQNISWIRS
ncbi:hypothetical protein OSTOST_02410, partial [Ostertagia ostertagi]